MRLLGKLANPMALVAQGFVLGAALFFATYPSAAEAFSEFGFTQAVAAPRS